MVFSKAFFAKVNRHLLLRAANLANPECSLGLSFIQIFVKA